MEDIFYFGSPVAKHTLSLATLDSVNGLADQVLNKTSEQDLKDQSIKLFSAVNAEVKFPFYMLEDFTEEIKKLALKFHQSFTVPSKDSEVDLKISHMWIVSQKETEWGYLHSHTGSISGILYLKVPKDMGSGLDLEDKRRNLAGCISFAEGVPGPYRRAVKHVKPAEGDLYLFPSDLMHTIYPFFGNEERRSLSFNIQVSKK